MTDRRTGMPLNDSDKQGQGVQGLAGERTEERGVPRPELRREVDTPDGPIVVEESSGTAFAEATGAHEQIPADPNSDGAVPEGPSPA